MELFILSQHEQPLTVISEDTGLVEAPYRIERNSVPTEPFSFTIEADQPVAEHVKEENKVVFKDHEGDWRLMTIKEVDDSNDMNGPTTIATCEPTFLAELNDHVVVDRRFVEQTADVALTAAVDGTRWTAQVDVELGRATTNFYYISSTEAIWKTIETWGGEFKDVVEFDEETNSITGCYVKIIQRLGKEQGQRFEIDHNTTEIGRTVLSYPKTALYGRGASLEIEDEDGEHTGGYTRYIDFADVEWKKSNGDPVDKPLGQKWVGDPGALVTYGYENGFKHRFGIFSNQDYEDPAELLQATWEALQNAKKPEVNYRLSAQLFNEKVSLGDTSQAIDRRFARPIEIQARVIAMEYDLMDIEGTTVVEMGQFLDLGDNRLDDLEREVEGIKNRPPSARIDEDSYPNIKPGTPVNVEAYGGREVIQLYWEYASQIYVKHYEVYGSQTADFIPDSQHLLWRGNTSAFAHTVGTDEVWYYRIRAVNYHGTPSDWSEQVRAATHRVISDDILWGPELAERMRELHRISDIIGENGVNFDQISQEAKDLINRQARIYTDEEIQATRDDIMDELDIRTDDLYDSVADLNQRAQDLINRADNVDDILYDYNVRIDETERGLEFKADSLEVDLINRTVEGHTTEIEILAEGLSSKVSETFVRDAIDGIEIGGRNLLVGTKELVDSFPQVAHNGRSFGLYGYDWNFNFSVKLDEGTTYTISVPVYNPSDSNSRARIVFSDTDHGRTSSVVSPKSVYMFTYTFTANSNYNTLLRILTHQPTMETLAFGYPQLEEGNKATDWSPAPEDILSVQESHWTEITQNSRKIDLQAESIIDINGNIESAEARITVLSDEISERVEKTVFNEETGSIRNSIASVRNFAEGIEQTVSSIEIGGRNLATGTSNILRDKVIGQYGSTLSEYTVEIDNDKLRFGDDISASVFIKDIPSGESVRLRIDWVHPDGGYSQAVYGDISSEDGRFTVTHMIPQNGKSGNGNDISGVRVRVFPGNWTRNFNVKIKEFQLEKGNKPTDWSPAPEDTDQRMTQAESSITQLADDITLKVDVDNIVSEINVNREGLRLSGALIHLNGLSRIDEAIIQAVHIADGAIERAKLGTAVIGTAQIENGAITNAKIANATIDNAKIASLSATKLTAGTIDGNIVKIQGGSSIDYTLIDGSLLESRGRFTRTWRGSTATHDIKLRFRNGYLQARNDSANHSLYISDFGISTFADGVGDGASGTIAFRDTEYSSAGGLTVQSTSGVVALRSDNNRVVTESQTTTEINSATASIYLKPMRENRLGLNEFAFRVKDNDSVSTTDGWISFGNVTGGSTHGSGIRFSKSISNPTIYMTNIHGDLNSAKASAISFIGDLEARYDNAHALVNEEFRVLNKSGSAPRDFQARHGRFNTVRVNDSGANFYIGTSTGEVRVTDNNLAAGLYRPIRVGEVILDGGGRLVFENGFTYIQGNNEIRASRVRSSTLVPVRAASFPTGSSEKVKENIVKFEKNALDIVRNSVIYEYNRIGLDCKRELGFIIERETPNEVLYDVESVNGYSHSSLNTKAIQELDARLNNEINWQRIEYQALKNRVTKLEERIEELEEMVA